MNAGARLHRVYCRLAGQVTDQMMVQTWAEVFELDKSLPSLEHEVTKLVMALQSEIKFARVRLDAYGVPENLTSPAFELLTQIASPGQLHSSWNSHRASINLPEYQKVFAWVEWALREEDEADMSADEMLHLRSELDDLESSLREIAMAPHLRDFIQQQIGTIRSALRLYGVQGVKPIQDALQMVVGAYKIQEKPLAQAYEAAEPPAKKLFERVAGAFAHIANFSDSICKIKNAGEVLTEVGNAVSAFMLPYIKNS